VSVVGVAGLFVYRREIDFQSGRLERRLERRLGYGCFSCGLWMEFQGFGAVEGVDGEEVQTRIVGRVFGDERGIEGEVTVDMDFPAVDSGIDSLDSRMAVVAGFPDVSESQKG
jgi:hypothetical protein